MYLKYHDSLSILCLVSLLQQEVGVRLSVDVAHVLIELFLRYAKVFMRYVLYEGYRTTLYSRCVYGGMVGICIKLYIGKRIILYAGHVL